MKKTIEKWKICSRGHKYQGNGPCPFCWLGSKKRKMFLFMMVSLDGFFEGPGHDLSWHNVDEEFNEFAISTR